MDDELLAAFLGMDESQRMAIIKFTGFAAAIGPALLILGKTIGTVGKLSSSLGKFALGMGKFSASITTAGGGLCCSGRIARVRLEFSAGPMPPVEHRGQPNAAQSVGSFCSPGLN